MKKIAGQVKSYIAEVDKKIFLSSALFIGILIFLNYYLGIEKRILHLPELQQYFSWFFIFLLSFSLPHLLQYFLGQSNAFKKKRFIFLLLAGPAIFAWKISANIYFDFSGNELKNSFWNHIAYWPFKLLVVTACLFFIWKIFDPQQPFYGLSRKGFQAKPYWLMLLMMIPLIALAATQQDFLALYPKFKSIGLEGKHAWKLLLYELSYGTDFFSIELFFRGFLILAFTKWVGKDAILPMALFYCTIHFGKPPGECISSFFGGLVLGVITHHAQTIYGGLMVHLGVAWLMELAGYVGRLIF
jgi:hypothetical protein